MFYQTFLCLLVCVFVSCHASETYTTSGKQGDVKSTIQGVKEVVIRDMILQMPISPVSEPAAFPQRVAIALEELDGNGNILRQSVCRLNIEKVGEVAGKEFRCLIYPKNSRWKKYVLSTDGNRKFPDEPRSKVLNNAFDYADRMYQDAGNRQRATLLYTYDVKVRSFISPTRMSLMFKPVSSGNSLDYSDSRIFLPSMFDCDAMHSGRYVQCKMISDDVPNQDVFARHSKSLEWKKSA